METNKSLCPSESSVIEDGPKPPSKKIDRIVAHLFVAPMALLVFIGTFGYQCVVIPTVGKLLFCLVAMSISVCILKRSGRRLYPTLKNEKYSTTVSRNSSKKIVVYYTGFLIIVLLTVTAGSYLNTHYLDVDKATQNRTHFEKIFRMNSNESSTL